MGPGIRVPNNATRSYYTLVLVKRPRSDTTPMDHWTNTPPSRLLNSGIKHRAVGPGIRVPNNATRIYYTLILAKRLRSNFAMFSNVCAVCAERSVTATSQWSHILVCKGVSVQYCIYVFTFDSLMMVSLMKSKARLLPVPLCKLHALCQIITSSTSYHYNMQDNNFNYYNNSYYK